MMEKNMRAFTLIELLVVVLIIAILAAVALPQYQLAVMKSRFSTLKALTKAIVQAQEVYYLANGTYANDFSKLDISMPGGKLPSSTKREYEYDWGNCKVVTGASGDGTAWYVGCTNSLINMRYLIYLAHSSYSPNARRCMVLGEGVTSNDGDIRHKVCHADGATKHNATKDDYVTWTYL